MPPVHYFDLQLVCGLCERESPLAEQSPYESVSEWLSQVELPAVDFAVKTTRFMLCIESSRDNKMFADAYKGALRSHAVLTMDVDVDVDVPEHSLSTLLLMLMYGI